ncbi:MAG: vitamin B12 transporter [Sulfurimonas sp.]|jgi:vitamin B12 transporter|uniref:TonB-dependent receptor plug domain-containing protein n=1 Tax=Sulfurimonas sp. TaxID=2022749 RepID=UPI0039E65139
MSKNIPLSFILVALFSSVNADQTIELEPITVVSATKTKQSIQDVTSNISVITSEELEEKHPTTVQEALSNLSGISLVSNGGLGASTSVLLRGMNNSRTLVLIDGIRFQDPSSTSGANFSHLMASDIERIEVIKGAQSGVWGADASAGVINIITKDSKKGQHVSANLEYGSFNTKKYAASISHKDEKLDLKLSANRITSDSFSVQSPRGDDVDQYEDDTYENTTVNFKAGYAVNNDITLKFNFTNIDAIKDYDSYNNPDDSNMKSDIDNQLYSLQYLHTIGEHDITLKYENSQFERDEIGTVAQFGSEYVKNFNGETKNLELNDDYSYAQNSFLLLGVGMSSDDVNFIKTDSSKTQKENENKYLYSTNSNKFDKIVFTQSIRHDNYNNFDDKTTGKLGLKYNLNQDMSVSSNIGSGYNVPNIVQELNPWGAINENLNPENTKSFDLSFNYKSLELTYFYQKIKNLIEWYDPDGYGGNPAIYKNLNGNSTFQGIEAAYSRNIIEDLTFTSNYTYLSAKDNDKEELARRPKHTANLGLDYYGLEDLHLGVYGQYTGERYDRANKQGQQTGKYTLVNVAANYDINDKVMVYVKIDNLFDKYYQVVDGYAAAPLSAYVGLKASF